MLRGRLSSHPVAQCLVVCGGWAGLKLGAGTQSRSRVVGRIWLAESSPLPPGEQESGAMAGSAGRLRQHSLPVFQLF